MSVPAHSRHQSADYFERLQYQVLLAELIQIFCVHVNIASVLFALIDVFSCLSVGAQNCYIKVSKEISSVQK